MKEGTPSKTALKVALNIVALGASPKMKAVMPEGLVSSTIDLLLASKIAHPWKIKLTNSTFVIKLAEYLDFLLPGQFEGFAKRRAFFERQVRNGLKEGASQVLVLGAGYDTLAWRLSKEFETVNFFEIDHPPTSSVKQIGIEKMGKSNNHILIARDLSKHKLSNVLENNSKWNRESVTIIIAEGLLMYLRSEDVKELFNQCFQVVGTDSRFTFTYVKQGIDGRPYAGPYSALILKSLELKGEPWLWSTQDELFDKMLSETGWKFSPELIGEDSKCGIEYLGVAEKNS